MHKVIYRYLKNAYHSKQKLITFIFYLLFSVNHERSLNPHMFPVMMYLSVERVKDLLSTLRSPKELCADEKGGGNASQLWK